jgi:DNA-binding response OmpR family regulator
MKILAVDDEFLICELLNEFLSLQGYEVTSSTSGQEALVEFETNRPDVVILDIRMPGMSGIDVLRKIKDMDSSVIVIMLSAFGDSSTVEEALKSGADYYMEKPLEFDHLMKILNAI